MARRVVVAIAYSGERELLWLQMNEMVAAVDSLVVVEATRDFQGRPRRVYFDASDAAFARFRHKVHHHVVCAHHHPPRHPGGAVATWAVEGMTRYAPLLREAALVGEDDVVVALDTDEIPTARSLRALRTCGVREAGAFRLRGFAYSFEWARPKVSSQASYCTGRYARRVGGCRLEGRRHATLPSAAAGVSLSKFGGFDFYLRRMQTNVNEQGVPITPSFAAARYAQALASVRAQAAPAGDAERARLCTLVYEPEMLPPFFFNRSLDSGWPAPPLPPSRVRCSVACRGANQSGTDAGADGAATYHGERFVCAAATAGDTAEARAVLLAMST